MPDLPTLQSGLINVWQDALAFLADVSFAQPGWLWLSLLPAALSILSWLAVRQQRVAVSAVGRPAAVFGLLTGPRRGGRLSRFALFVAWSLVVLGAAGPRWGKGDDDGTAVGRDVVIVLDVSRSMLAEDMTRPPARWQAALLGVSDLLDSLQTRGGHRAALVIFAAKPRLVVPLTTDLDHLRSKLAEIDMAHLPPDVRPDEGSKSGTRFGAALLAGLEAHDPRFPGHQDIVLISDGDDPAASDREWVAGVSAARRASIPVHAVGVGDPERDSPIVVGQDFLEAQTDGVRSQVTTRLREETLHAIADEGRGTYLPARRDVPKLGDFFRQRIEPNPTRELADELVPQPRNRSAWFLGFGLLFLAIAWVREK